MMVSMGGAAYLNMIGFELVRCGDSIDKDKEETKEVDEFEEVPDIEDIL
jgi:hypothetical protein